jgi:hyperosmotically inducible protein
MKRPTNVFITCLLLLVAVACSNVSKTSEQAPKSTNTTTEAPKVGEAQDINKDASNETRRKQLNADIRAREQRNNAAGKDAKRSDDDIRSEVRSKLEANLPASQLTVDAKDGNVSIAGTVPTQPQHQRIAPLAREIYGVKSVDVKVNVAPAKRPD